MRKKTDENIEWALQFESVRRMFDRLSVKKSGSKDTERMYARSLHHFYEFSGMTPDYVVELWKKQASGNYEEALEDWDVKLDQFVKWLMEKKGLKKSSAVDCHASIKALVKYNSRLKMAIGTPGRGIQKALQPITLEEFRDLDAVADEQQRFIIRALKDSGMSRKDFVALNYGDVRKEFEAGEKFIHIHAIRRKEELEYDTFIGPNAVEALKIYLRIRRNRGEILNDDTPLVASQKEPYPRLTPDNVTQIIDRLGEKIGITASPHRLRKTFESYMALEVRHPIILKYWMGHKLASDIEARYVLPPVQEQKALYQKAYKGIDLNQVASMDEFLKTIEEVKASLPPELRAKAERLGIIIRQKKEISKVKKTMPNGGSADCQKIVDETQLEGYLAKGWKVQAVLPSGRVVISNE